MFKYVPLKCVDETTEVGEDTIREYIYCAIIEEDPAVKKFHKTFQNLAEKIADVDKKIKTISKMNFLGYKIIIFVNYNTEISIMNIVYVYMYLFCVLTVCI